LRGIEGHLGEFAARGIRPVAISVDPPGVSRDHCRKQGYTYTFLSDQQTEVIRRYDVLHPQGHGEQAIARPAEFLIDSNGIVRWANFTENLWVRATPEQMLHAMNSIQ
jgi:peroxiredoxin